MIDKIKNIIAGHLNELSDKYAELKESRLEICYKCPLCVTKSYGPVCSSKMWINPTTLEAVSYEKSGYKRGCGCRLYAKTTLKDEHCIINKW